MPELPAYKNPQARFLPEVTTAPTESLIPYVNNARTHPPEQVAQIAASIAEFGFVNPILVDGENGVIAGHGRLLAAQKLGLAEVPTIQLAHLSEHQKKALVLADNRITQNAGWDYDFIRVELASIAESGFDIDFLGFTATELETLLQIDDEPTRLDETFESKEFSSEDFSGEHCCPRCGFEF